MSPSLERILASLLCVALGSCHWTKPASDAPDASFTHSAAASEPTVVAITLPRFQPDLPPGPGREAFAGACLSCHSTRYISIQPPLTAPKWDESVRKMIKTYGAPIAEEQVQPIVQYLMATKETEANLWSAMTPVVAATRFEVVGPSSDIERGARVYAQDCASCHGPAGAGDGATAGTMLPRPTDLTSVRFSDEAMCSAIAQGVPATAMPGHSQLSREDLSATLAFTKKLAPAPAKVAVNDEGKGLFAKNCIECHGSAGLGDGIAAPPLPRPPTNFRAVQPSRDAAMRAISEGVPGTAMPAWKMKLSEPQREFLADYVRSFYSED
ncbi:MAG: c-type cytochrome [Tepidisphaeraceae bacterium]